MTAAGALLTGVTLWCRVPGVTERPAAEGLTADGVASFRSGECVVSEGGNTGRGLAATVNAIRRRLTASGPILPGELESSTVMDLLRQWAALDPEGAVRMAAVRRDLHGRDDFAAELLVGWMDTNPDAAMAWAIALPDGELRWQLMPAIVAGLAEENPGGALKMALMLEGRFREQSVRAVFSEWSAFDIHAATDAALRLKSIADRAVALLPVVEQMAESDPAAAAAWVLQNCGPVTGASADSGMIPIVVVLEKWVARAPEDAAAFLVASPCTEARTAGLRAVAAQWAEQDPEQALQWAATLTSDGDKAILSAGVIATVAERSVRTATGLALTLSAGSIRDTSLALLLDRWTASDPSGLSLWATSQMHSGGGDGLMPVIEAWAGTADRSLASWLNSLPPGRLRDGYFAGVARHLALRQSGSAALWADAIEEDGLRKRTAAEIDSLISGR